MLSVILLEASQYLDHQVHVNPVLFGKYVIIIFNTCVPLSISQHILSTDCLPLYGCRTYLLTFTSASTFVFKYQWFFFFFLHAFSSRAIIFVNITTFSKLQFYPRVDYSWSMFVKSIYKVYVSNHTLSFWILFIKFTFFFTKTVYFYFEALYILAKAEKTRKVTSREGEYWHISYHGHSIH